MTKFKNSSFLVPSVAAATVAILASTALSARADGVPNLDRLKSNVQSYGSNQDAANVERAQQKLDQAAGAKDKAVKMAEDAKSKSANSPSLKDQAKALAEKNKTAQALKDKGHALQEKVAAAKGAATNAATKAATEKKEAVKAAVSDKTAALQQQVGNAFKRDPAKGADQPTAVEKASGSVDRADAATQETKRALDEARGMLRR